MIVNHHCPHENFGGSAHFQIDPDLVDGIWKSALNSNEDGLYIYIYTYIMCIYIYIHIMTISQFVLL